MERISRFRAILLLILFITILALFALKLFDLQIIKTNGNTDNIAKYTTVTTVRAARGDILDRNGNVLVGNRASYDLVFNHYVIESYGQTNEALYALVHKCRDLNLSYNDHFPVSKTRPFEYTLNDFATSWQNHFQSFMVDRSLDSDITAPLLIEKLRERYKIPEGWSDEDARAVIGMRYEFDLRGISKLPTYTFIQDISDENLSAILELNIPGLMVESSTVREYHTKYAAHILGYMGGMDDDDWEKYQKEGYFLQEQNQIVEVSQLMYEGQSYKHVFLEDIKASSSEILIMNAHYELGKIKSYFDVLQEKAHQNVQLYVVLNDEQRQKEMLVRTIEGMGAAILYSNHSAHFVVIDKEIIWYSDMDFLGRAKKDGLSTRLKDPHLVNEIMKIAQDEQLQNIENDKKISLW